MNFKHLNNIDMKKIMNTLAQFKQWILFVVIVRIFNGKLLVDNREIKKYIYLFYKDDNFYTNMCETITAVKFYKTRGKYIVKITTYRPCLIIGKAGADIDNLKEFINRDFFNLPVTIELEECKMWFNLYAL